MVANVCDQDEAKISKVLKVLEEQEITSLSDLKDLAESDLEESIADVKPPKRRAALREALLPLIKSKAGVKHVTVSE